MWPFTKRKPLTADFSGARFPPVTNPYATSRHTATIAQTSRPSDAGFDGSGFVVGMMTGVPLSPSHGFSTGAFLGAALHTDSPAHSEPAHFSGHGGESGGGGASASYDSGSSSSSSDSSSSSSSSD